MFLDKIIIPKQLSYKFPNNKEECKMEIKPTGPIPYTEKTFNEYKVRLVNTLIKEGLDADQIFNDSEAKAFITNYVEQELMSEKKDTERLILGTNIRLVHMEIDSPRGKKTYPLVNEYKGHHLMKTYYFYKKDNKIQMGVVEVNPTSIII